MQQNTEVSQPTNIALLPPAERAVLALESTKTEKQLRELVTYSGGIVTVTDKDSREQAHRAGMNLKNARVAIEKVGKAAREDAQAFSKAVIAEEKRLIGITHAEEDRVLGLRDGYDAEQARKKAEAERIERERVARIQGQIAAIRTIPLSLTGATAAEMAEEIEALELFKVGEHFAEMTDEATAAAQEALATLREMHARQVASEAEAARVAAEKAELEHQKAEVAERERIAAEARATEQAQRDEERAELEQLRAEKAAREAAALLAGLEAAGFPCGGDEIVLGAVPADGTVADLELPDGRQALDAARDVAPEGKPLVVTYDGPAITATFIGVDMGAGDKTVVQDVELQVDEREKVRWIEAEFRKAARMLLATHSTEQARIIFDEELQRAIYGEAA